MSAALETPSASLAAPELASYLPIAEHGVIGDLHTVALVGTDGTIDWYSPDRFDGPSVFAGILDRRLGGFYRIAPSPPATTTKQLYLPDTNVLITRFLSPEGIAEIQDFMPIGAEHEQLIRRVVGIRGLTHLRLQLEPRFDYARAAHTVLATDAGAIFRSDEQMLGLSAAAELELTERGVAAEFTVAAGESYTFALTTGASPARLTEPEAEELMRETAAFWRGWLAQSTYTGRWRETVHRSALTLKLLTYAPTGALLAAATTSLPEQIGGPRNWDYRYSWIRDSAFSVYALLRLGFREEARAFTQFGKDVALSRSSRANGPLDVLYGIDAESELSEQTLDHLEGYEGSGPVRIGNAASTQIQLDIYGELIDSIYLIEQLGARDLLPLEGWRELSKLIDWLCLHWQDADDGIWEVRNGPRRFTYSHLMCWVAFDRAIRIATDRGLPADLPRWTAERDAAQAWIMERGWSDRRQAFVQSEGADVLDASLLLMPLVHFIGPTDPRWLSTLDAIGAELVSDSLVYRYDPLLSPDGLEGTEGTFSMCTFWYAECLARADRIEEAQLVFEKMLTYANHLGLYSEQIGQSGELLGNFPQAFTHLALISAATQLDRKLSQPGGVARAAA